MDIDGSFEREKWLAELDLKKRELDIKESEQATRDAEHELRKKEHKTSTWRSPLTVAIFAAAVAAFGNALVTVVNGNLQRDLEGTRHIAGINIERSKAESTRILEMIKTGDTEKAAGNLEFLLKSGLVSDPTLIAKLDGFLKSRVPGRGPSLPALTGRVGHDQSAKSAIVKLYTEANEMAMLNLALEKAKKSQRFGDTELALAVPAKYIRLRSDGLGLIELLTTRLLSVGALEDGQEAVASFQALGTSAKIFAEANNKDGLKRYAEPVVNLADIVIALYDVRGREIILKAAVETGIPSARAILAEIRKDFEPDSPTSIVNALREELSLNKAEKINTYNLILLNEEALSQSEKLSPKKITARYNAILDVIAAEKTLSAFNGNEVINVIESLDQALDSLQKAAISGFKSGDPGRASKEIVELSRRTLELLNSVSALQ